MFKRKHIQLFWLLQVLLVGSCGQLLAQHAILEGSLTARDYHALPSLTVVAYRLAIDMGSIRPQIECRAAADTTGHFRCEDLPEGNYLLAAAPSEFAISRGLPCQGVAQTFYPGTADVDQALMIHLQSYDTIEADFSMLKAAANPLTFRFPDEVRNKVDLFLVGTRFILTTVSEAPELGAEQEETLCGFGRSRHMISDAWTKDALSSRAITYFQPGATEQVLISEGSTTKVHGSLVLASPSKSRGEVHFTAIDVPERPVVVAMTDRNGSFDVVLGKGRYSVGVEAAKMYVDRLMLDEQNQAGSLLDLRSSPPSVSLNVSAVASSAALEVVPCETNVTGRDIGFVLFSPTTHEIRASRAVGAISYFLGLAPGIYRLNGWEHFRETPYNDEGVLQNDDVVSTSIVVDRFGGARKICSALNSFHMQ